MKQWNGNDASSSQRTDAGDDTAADTAADTDATLLDDLGSVSTMNFPAVHEDPRTSAMPVSLPPALTREKLREQKRHHRRMVALTVVLVLLGLVAVAGGIYYGMQKNREVPATDAAYTESVSAATSERSTLTATLDSTKDTVASLMTALPDSEEVQDFSQTWDRGQTLVETPPKYFSTRPSTDDQRTTAISDLADYTTTMRNVSQRLAQQEKTAGQSDAERLFTAQQASLGTAIQQGKLVLSDYDAKKSGFTPQSDADADADADTDADGDSSSAGSDSAPVVPFDTSLVTTLNDALAHASDLANSTKEGTPVTVATTAISLRTAAADLKVAYEALQKGVNEAVAQAAEAKNDDAKNEARLNSTDGRIPSALQGTWKTADGTTMTFTADTLQSHHASATRQSTAGVKAEEGGSVVARWSLDAGGVDKGIENTTVTLCENDGQEYLVVTTGTERWKLTR